MTATVYQIRDFQSKKDIERMQRELEKEAASIQVPYNGAGIDGMPYQAKDADPA